MNNEQLHVLIPKYLKEELTQAAKRQGYTRSTFIRNVLELYLAYLEDKEAEEQPKKRCKKKSLSVKGIE